MAAKKAPKAAKAKPEPDAAERAVHESLRRAQQIWSSGIGTTLGVLKEADANLSAQLHAIVAKHGGPSGTFTEASAQVYRKQINLATEYLEKRLTGVTHATAMKALKTSVADTVHLARTFEHKFTGITRPLALESQQMQDEAIRGPGASLLRRHTSSWNRYGKAMTADFERVLRTSSLEGLTHHQTVSRLVEAGKLGGHNAASLHANEPGYFPEPTSYVKRRYWAERIVRTENQHALNAGALQAMNVTRGTEFPDLQKKILAIMDNRTAPDSIAVHGQVRKLEEMFVDGAGRQYLHPPARPNDREHIIPWRPHWEHTPATQPAPAEVQAQAVVDAQPSPLGEKRKGELGAALQKAKEKVLAQKAAAQAEKQKAQDFVLAQAKAQAAQAEGSQLLGAAKLADEAALKAAADKVTHAELPGAKFSAAKAKAEAYLAQKKAIAEAKAAARAAEAEARLAAEVKQAKETWTQPDIFEGPKDVLDTLKAYAKSKPKAFARLYSEVTGKPAESVLGKIGNPMQLGNLTKQLGKKLQPDLAWPKPKPKKAPELTFEQKKAQLLAPNANAEQLKQAVKAFGPEELHQLLKGNPLILPGEVEEVLAGGDPTAWVHQVVSDWEKLKTQAASAELKDTPASGKHYVDVYQGGKKVAFYFKEGTAEKPEWAVKPPLEMHATHGPKVFEQQVEATAYALEVGKQYALNVAAKQAEAASIKAAAAKNYAEAAAAKTKAAQAAREAAAAARNKPWASSWKEPEREEADLRAKPAKQLAELPKHRAGQGVALDEDYIENFDVSFTREKVGGKDEVVVRFKVTSHREHQVLANMAKAGSKTVEYGYRKLKGFDNPELHFDPKIDERAIGVKAYQAEKGGVRVTFLHQDASDRYSGNLAAAHNVVEMRFEATNAQAMAQAQKGFDLLGIGTAAPSAETLLAYKRAKILAYMDPDSAKELWALKERTPAAVQGVWEKSVKRNPKLAAVAEDAELREVSPGHHALYSRKVAKELEEAGVQWVTHKSGSGPEVIEQVLATPEAGLLSSRERYQRGLFVEGMSTDEDFKTGGADSVFTRLQTTNPADLQATYGRWTFQIDPSELGRLDAYAFNEDNYGKANAHESRETVSEMADIVRRGRLSGTNEVMFQRQVGRSSIRRVIANTIPDRDDLLKRLRARGVHEINGVPVDEFVVLRQ